MYLVFMIFLSSSSSNALYFV